MRLMPVDVLSSMPSCQMMICGGWDFFVCFLIEMFRDVLHSALTHYLFKYTNLSAFHY